ncbi:MAG TPA: hypothetical protein VL201_01020 [Patescibacteria group bacterium]|nr:hypothetical protein [Patescibacteria group bacterium]
MSSKNFINSNTNKNKGGFLLTDIVLGLIIFMSTGYYCLSVLIKNYLSLEGSVKNTIILNNCSLAAKQPMYAKTKEFSNKNKYEKNLKINCQFDVKKIDFIMYNGYKLAVELVVTKSNTSDGVSEYICYAPRKK